MKYKIKPCPFCGRSLKESNFDETLYTGHTKKCLFSAMEFMNDFHIYDINVWNTRKEHNG